MKSGIEVWDNNSVYIYTHEILTPNHYVCSLSWNKHVELEANDILMWLFQLLYIQPLKLKVVSLVD